MPFSVCLDSRESPSKTQRSNEETASYLSLVEELEENCPVCVRPHNHGPSRDSGQVAAPPLCHISSAAIPTQQLEVPGAQPLGPGGKASP